VLFEAEKIFPSQSVLHLPFPRFPLVTAEQICTCRAISLCRRVDIDEEFPCTEVILPPPFVEHEALLTIQRCILLTILPIVLFQQSLGYFWTWAAGRGYCERIGDWRAK